MIFVNIFVLDVIYVDTVASKRAPRLIPYLD